MIYDITLAVTFFLLGLLYGNLYGQYKTTKNKREKDENQEKPNNINYFISICIVVIIGIILCFSVYLDTSKEKKKQFRQALIEDNKATYLCDKYGVVTFHITDTEMTTTREVLGEHRSNKTKEK